MFGFILGTTILFGYIWNHLIWISIWLSHSIYSTETADHVVTPQELTTTSISTSSSIGPKPMGPKHPQVLEPSAAPSYIFDASVLRRRRDLVKRATVLGTAYMERHMSHVRVPQFAVGFRGAGAPMHTHHAALNASFAGPGWKRWKICVSSVLVQQ